jgi:hypothetical protein
MSFYNRGGKFLQRGYDTDCELLYEKKNPLVFTSRDTPNASFPRWPTRCGKPPDTMT